jgi:hypothetical protein
LQVTQRETSKPPFVTGALSAKQKNRLTAVFLCPDGFYYVVGPGKAGNPMLARVPSSFGVAEKKIAWPRSTFGAARPKPVVQAYLRRAAMWRQIRQLEHPHPAKSGRS